MLGFLHWAETLMYCTYIYLHSNKLSIFIECFAHSMEVELGTRVFLPHDWHCFIQSQLPMVSWDPTGQRQTKWSPLLAGKGAGWSCHLIGWTQSGWNCPTGRPKKAHIPSRWQFKGQWLNLWKNGLVYHHLFFTVTDPSTK